MTEKASEDLHLTIFMTSFFEICFDPGKITSCTLRCDHIWCTCSASVPMDWLLLFLNGALVCSCSSSSMSPGMWCSLDANEASLQCYLPCDCFDP
ncbi:hypothetical protein DUNSADRAFT_15673 [Dunaliella salina]|uniref:Uncharacterized protein n=1 Tax=Dunaliella salina TaxID=3046 RepID=A0ABQ7G4Z5_DUNSA|nr:hypothetical protein DUNSADRAFT_15673 [Dunaliella salina]|eukprot:KAF5829674.1 hypothetical protein DUNSADRAFT_15673 [Dunaliella salina]